MGSDYDAGAEWDAPQQDAESNYGAQNPYIVLEKPLHLCVAP
jgi:hypothetical protein